MLRDPVKEREIQKHIEESGIEVPWFVSRDLMDVAVGVILAIGIGIAVVVIALAIAGGH